MTTALVICGALAREVLTIVEHHKWDVKVVGVPASDHVFPERIAPDVKKRYLQLKEDFDRVIVVFGDCGSRGALDEFLTEHGLERIDGPHCYEMYGGDTFNELMEEEPGTYFLTDFLVRVFRGTIVKSMGLDRFPELKSEYFRNYRRVVYLMQSHDLKLVELAHDAADFLGLPLEIRFTGYGMLERRLVALIKEEEQP